MKLLNFKIKYIVPVLLLIVLLNGCATVIGMNERNDTDLIYIGTRIDASAIVGDGIYSDAFRPFAIIDLPLSFALDTLFLPFSAMIYCAGLIDNSIKTEN